MRIRVNAVGGLVVTVAAAVAVALVAPSAQAGDSRSGSPAAGRAIVVKDSGDRTYDPVLVETARRFGLPVRRLDKALVDLKVFLGSLPEGPKAGPFDPRALAVFAKSLGVSTARATAVLKFLLSADRKKDGGKDKPGETTFPPEAVAFFAKTLHVSVKRAQVALDQIMKLASGPKGGVDPGSRAFARIARSLGVSPKKLNAALVALKKYIATLPPDKPGQPKPGEPKPGQPKPGEPKPGQPKPGTPTKPAG